jgi:hypothetical protein
MKALRLHPEDLQAIITGVAVQLRPALADADPELTRVEAAKFCRISMREFDRERTRYPDALKPARHRRPLLWRRSTLEVYRASRGALVSG